MECMKLGKFHLVKVILGNKSLTWHGNIKPNIWGCKLFLSLKMIWLPTGGILFRYWEKSIFCIGNLSFIRTPGGHSKRPANVHYALSNIYCNKSDYKKIIIQGTLVAFNMPLQNYFYKYKEKTKHLSTKPEHSVCKERYKLHNTRSEN